MAAAQSFVANRKTAGPAAVATFESVSKNFGSARALVDFNFEVRAGELLTLLGPNGAGKTTAIRLLLGLVRANSGRLSVFGGDPASVDTHVRVGAMMQVGRVPETLKVREHIDLFSSYYPNPLPISETLAIAGLEKLKAIGSATRRDAGFGVP
jgi:ABC-2 type transport system ATP-binding protein